ncbi:MAG TPA: ATP-binding protein [Nitrospiraceae bacterium]|jgi:signal transduction histidine kinase/CHASE3 domain sensor protein|nr:ATP-binding protein [Nitrospiraceae bacterium]
MDRWAAQWGDRLRIQHKVWVVLLLLCVPLSAGIAIHLYVVQQLLALQQQRQELMLADEQVLVLGRLAIDIEDGFRGYVLTQQPAFLAPLAEAEAKLDQALSDATQSLARLSGSPTSLAPIAQQLKDLLRSKHELIVDIQKGPAGKALAYVRSGEGLRLSDLLREDFRNVEDSLKRQRNSLNEQADALSQRTFVGLWITLAGVVALGWIVSRILARSLTDPITRLQTATARIGAQVDVAEITELLATGRGAKDELGQLAEAYLAMARRIETNIQEIEALDTIGQEVNTIGSDDLAGVLRRITDRAVELVQTDICLVLLRDERVGCWIVEAASGEWNDRLKKLVVPWEELPVSVQAFETREEAIGERFRSDEWPQMVRYNLIWDSMLAIPLLAQGIPFGVLSFLNERPRAAHEWNQRLAEGLALEAALAISNARLHEAAQQKQRGLVTRLRQLEHLAETLAHDLKGPGARMEELVRLLVQQDSGQFDDRTKRWLSLIEENSRDLVQRVEGILTVAHVGADQEAITAVDPTAIVGEVLKARADEIGRLHAVVHVEAGLPLVACHGAYLRQIFDNLVSNALKFTREGDSPVVRISGHVQGPMVAFSVEDDGIGIPSTQRTRVFQPFVRLLMSEAPGDGIGLTIIQRIVELYGGKVWIDGAEGPGCTVQFTIPSFQEQEEASNARMQASRVPDVVDVLRRGVL